MKNVKLYTQNGLEIDAKTNSDIDFTVFGELVFTTSMTGYQETITDPSFADQIIVMTYPIIGSYGVFDKLNQSDTIYAKAMIVSNCDHNEEFCNFMREKNIPIVITDTRNLVHLIRKFSYPKCVISTKQLNEDEKIECYSKINPNMIDKISTKEIVKFDGIVKNGKAIGVIDFGVKQGIINELGKYFETIYKLPYNSNFNSIESLNLNCILLSNGPGDPIELTEVIENIKTFFGKIDIFGICLGHQLLGLSLGCKTRQMELGHRGANHPVMNLQTGKIIITSQNHGYEIDANSLSIGVIVTHKNIHDGSIEGIECEKYRAKSVQFHPESSPGPNDAKIVFNEWFS